MNDQTHIKPDSEVPDQYRRANAALDARASATSRAAILAAAARAVEAGPRALESGGGWMGGWIRGWVHARQPVAIAASVVFGIGIGLTLFRGEPIGTSSTEQQVAMVQSEPQLASSKQASKPTSKPEVKPETKTVQETESVPEQLLGAAPSNVNEKQRPREAAPVSKATTPAAPASSGIAAVEHSAPAPMLARSAQTGEQDTDARTADVPGEPGRARNEAEATSQASERMAAASDAVRPPALAAPMNLGLAKRAAPGAAVSPLRKPEEWLAQIVLLRKNGQTDQADRELEAFRQAYPNLTVRPEALP